MEFLKNYSNQPTLRKSIQLLCIWFEWLMSIIKCNIDLDRFAHKNGVTLNNIKLMFDVKLKTMRTTDLYIIKIVRTRKMIFRSHLPPLEKSISSIVSFYFYRGTLPSISMWTKHKMLSTEWCTNLFMLTRIHW